MSQLGTTKRKTNIDFTALPDGASYNIFRVHCNQHFETPGKYILK